MNGTRYKIEINPELPQRLVRLNELANNLWYSWDRPTRSLFARLHPGLWKAVKHSPKAFLKRVDQKRLRDIESDQVYLGTLNRVLAAHDTYHTRPVNLEWESKTNLTQKDRIAYFCAEFGFHESLPIYSGGLGILAGDHCKGASDLFLPFTAVGLLYRQGYFQQFIDRDGQQHAIYEDNDFDDMPIEQVMDAEGKELRVSVDFPGRAVWIKVWKVRVGNAELYLLDTNLEENSPEDRNITHQLYGGDRRARLEQELLLGIGGVRTLRAVGIEPTVWHINEGHAAFLILERMRGLVKDGLDFATALEAAAVNTVFTTHTPVPAGHDHFSDDMVLNYLAETCDAMGLGHQQFLDLGHVPGEGGFNMTALALRGSRFHNGVSRIHGNVSADICHDMWPQIAPVENPMTYVTNSVHVPTFLATDWYETFDRYLGHGWQYRQTDTECWQGVHRIPDQIFWSIRQSLKAQMLHLVRDRVRKQHLRNQGSETHLDRMLRLADPANPTVLTIGFARRFATYKRANLIANDLQWLREIIKSAKQPVLFIFAGKAHPADEPGQALIREISALARNPDYEGHILLVEGYDLHLARRLVAGVDVWLNTPIYPLEASGTSGMKAAINGAINLSVLDGWWGEGFDGKNGWAIKPTSSGLNPNIRDAEEARTLYELLQDSVAPLYYQNTALGYSPAWVAVAKQSIASIMPRFNMHRMLKDYLGKLYAPAADQWKQYSAENFSVANEIAQWKSRVRNAWSGVRARRVDEPVKRINYGEQLHFEVAIQLNGLKPEDLKVELVFNRPDDINSERSRFFTLRPVQAMDNGEYLFSHKLTLEQCGKMEYRVRAYPSHPKLTHRFEMGMMVWV